MLPDHQLLLYFATYQWVMGGVVLLAILFCTRALSRLARLSSLLVVPLSAMGLAVCMGGDFFAATRLVAYGLFLYFPLFLLVTAAISWRRDRTMSSVYLTTAIAVLAVAIDAFWIEPHWLEETHYVFRSPKVSQPLRVVVIADLQTDHIGDYERMVLKRCMAQRPDVILWAGDYLQTADYREWHACCQRLNQLMHDLDVRAPLGMVAVGGNVDWPSWPEIFEGLPARTLRTTAVFPLTEEVEVVGLSVGDSFRVDTWLSATDKFRIVLGHCPNFAMGGVHADLLVAGHTHGGQVQLPFLGPLKSNARVPRGWAAGMTDLGNGRRLVVSRGIGMERLWAPRLRFLCRPELVILEVHPG